jgi:hypothetical protein
MKIRPIIVLAGWAVMCKIEGRSQFGENLCGKWFAGLEF